MVSLIRKMPRRRPGLTSVVNVFMGIEAPFILFRPDDLALRMEGESEGQFQPPRATDKKGYIRESGGSPDCSYPDGARGHETKISIA